MNKQISCICLLLCLVFPITSHSATLKVAVAANFKHTLKQLIPVFEKQSGHEIKIISAGTGQLANQVLQGAPFDILLAANKKHPKILFKKIKKRRQLDASALQIYALGRLALYSHEPFLQKDLLTVLSQPQLNKLAVANPRMAPYGLAAKQTLQHLKLDKTLTPHKVTGQNVAQVYQFVHTRNVDAGFVAYSMVKDAPTAQVLLVPENYHDAIEQMGLLLNNEKPSRQFMTFLSSKTAQDIIQAQGYRLPPLAIVNKGTANQGAATR